MKLINILATLGLLTSTTLLAQTTMCFKENHPSMTTIEKTALDGGECNSQKSVLDMKKDGWLVDDIKITGQNYIYIFKKEAINLSKLDEEKLEQRIMQKLETRKKEEIEAKKKKILMQMSEDGKKLYIDTCKQCHGEKAELKAHNTSRPIVNLNFNDFKQAIRDYTLREYDRGRAIIMRPYAIALNDRKIKNVYSYIQTLKPKKDSEKTKESK